MHSYVCCKLAYTAQFQLLCVLSAFRDLSLERRRKMENYQLAGLSDFLLRNVVAEKDDDGLQNSGRTFRTSGDAKMFDFFGGKFDVPVGSNLLCILLRSLAQVRIEFG